MSPGPEGESRVERDIDRRGVRRSAPGGYDPQPAGDADGRELRLAPAHPLTAGNRCHRVRRKRLAEHSRRLCHRALGVGCSAEERRQPGHRPARRVQSPGFPVNRRFPGCARVGVGRVNGQCTGFQQSVGPALRGVRGGVEGQSAILRRRTIRHRSCASPSAARDNGSTYRLAGTRRRAATPDAAKCWS